MAPNIGWVDVEAQIHFSITPRCEIDPTPQTAARRVCKPPDSDCPIYDTSCVPIVNSVCYSVAQTGCAIYDIFHVPIVHSMCSTDAQTGCSGAIHEISHVPIVHSVCTSDAGSFPQACH